MFEIMSVIWYLILVSIGFYIVYLLSSTRRNMTNNMEANFFSKDDYFTRLYSVHIYRTTATYRDIVWNWFC
ncbi:hypothetical protein CLHOM_27920 [Clostridium homopropionicum DSM 5847]|uniref:Uncharacterized protein n=1 Tax=Clostridium homopropionicum DSM 5847 TaxID=1121318 RepID=A0A0L6Z7T2_9CLOT|nr:hypothetical protein CLHOM_27920 [Clostridium homopropionicum DSM 5847]SFG90384.1 hypothetical protein SAMN04488501_12240 [Clostridium homopropionicum]